MSTVCLLRPCHACAHGQHAASPVQAVAVLADEVFQDALVLELDQCHVCQRRDGLQRARRLPGALPPLGPKRPRAIGASKVRDACENDE